MQFELRFIATTLQHNPVCIQSEYSLFAYFHGSEYSLFAYFHGSEYSTSLMWLFTYATSLIRIQFQNGCVLKIYFKMHILKRMQFFLFIRPSKFGLRKTCNFSCFKLTETNIYWIDMFKKIYRVKKCFWSYKKITRTWYMNYKQY